MTDRSYYTNVHILRGVRVRAFSLMEMILVLVIVAALAGLSWPMLMRPLSRSRVQQAAQDVRRALSDARQSAVEEGKTYQFRYQPGTPRFEVVAADSLEPAAEGLELDAAPIAADQDPQMLSDYEPLPDPIAPHECAELQDGVVFAHAQSSAEQDPLPDPPEPAPPVADLNNLPYPLWNDEDARAEDRRTHAADRHLATANDPAESVNEFAEDGETRWSDPIFFHPDGRTSSARVVLEGEEGDSVEVTLRGYTGAARVGRVQRRTVARKEVVPDDESPSSSSWGGEQPISSERAATLSQ